jgi:DNA-binding transcriptional MerR regulator
MGLQNAALLAAAPVAMLAAGLLVESIGLRPTGMLVAGAWVALLACTLLAPALRSLEPLAADGTTVRAVRHYHAIGLLPEPERDHSGYRRYGSTALLRLLRVRRMRDLGLPLERIADLLTGPETGLLDALDALDAELAAQAERIAAQRARLAELRASNPDPELPERLGRIFADAVAAGAPERAVTQEKEVLLLDMALHPERTETIIADYERLYARLTARPELLEITRRFDALTEAEPDDPEVEHLAAAFAAAFRDDIPSIATTDRGTVAPLTELLFQDWGATVPPAQRRLMDRIGELVESAARDRSASSEPSRSAPVRRPR